MKSIFKKFYIIALSAALLVNATACGKQTALSQPAPSSQSASLAGETTNHIYTQSIQNLEANAQASFDMFQSPLSFIVLDHGKVVNETSIGADHTWKPDTITNIGSVSKLFVTTSILYLQQEGKLSLEDPVTQYIPEFEMADPRYKDITIRMLLNHSSGLPGANYDNTFLFEQNNNQEYFANLLEDLKDETLNADPGSYAVYCNEGFILAQKIVENVSKEKYISFLKTSILEPMGITNLYGSSEADLPEEQFFPSYDQTGNKLPRELIIDGLYGTGGLSTDIKTLATFGENVLSPDKSVLNQQSIDIFRAIENKENTFGDANFFNALGWDYANYKFNDLPVYVKSGGTIQYLSQIVTAPDYGITVVGFSTNFSTVGQITEDLMRDILIENKYLEKSKDAITAPEAKDFDQNPTDYSGTYSVVGGALTIQADIQDSALSFSMVPLSTIGNDAGEMSYLYRTDDTFWSEPVDGLVEKFSFKELDGKIFLFKHFQSDTIQYEVVYAQKLEDLPANEEWAQRNNTLWLKANPTRNALLGMGDLITRLSVPEELNGYLYFVRQTPFKIENDTLAIASCETARDAGSLIYNNCTLSFRGSSYYSADKATTFAPEALDAVTFTQDNDTYWFKTDQPVSIDFQTEVSNIRIVSMDENGTPIFDNSVSTTPVDLPANTYIMVCGNQNAVLEYSIL